MAETVAPSGVVSRMARMIWFLVPSFSRFGLFARTGISVIIFGICADLFYAKVEPAFTLVKGALTFSPLRQAEEFVAKGHLKTAEEYIAFYSSIPGVTISPELEELARKIHDERHGIISGGLHQLKHAYRGAKGEESDEYIGQAADIIVDLTGAGDARDLYTEWRNYAEGREVDKLSAGLAGIGLAMTLGELGGAVSSVATGGTSAAASFSMFEPVKKTCLALKKALKFMNPKLKKACHALFEPVFTAVRKSHILSAMPNPARLGEVKAFAKRHLGAFGDIAKMANTRLEALGEIMTLARRDPAAAKLVLESAGTIKSASRLSKMALALGDAGRVIFRFGGRRALGAAETLTKKGALSAATLKQAMRVGKNGLIAVTKGCWRSLNIMLALAHKYAPLAWALLVQWLLSKIPLTIALLLEALGASVLLKTWLPRGKVRS